jgi:proline iminopeptidase
LVEEVAMSVPNESEPAQGIFWYAMGTGDPLVVLHGAMGFDHTYFRPWLDRLGDHARVVYLDLSGCGSSAGVNRSEEVSLERWAHDVEAVREAVGCERVTVLSHSMSAWVALEYARRWPERTSGLILCSGTSVFDYTEDIFAAASERASATQLADLQTIMGAQMFDDAAFRRLFLSILPLYFYRFDESYGARFASTLRFNAAVYLNVRDRYVASYDCRPMLNTVTARTLLLAGRYDLIAPPDRGSARLAKEIPEATLHVFEASGHFPFIEEPSEFAEVVGRWLKAG